MNIAFRPCPSCGGYGVLDSGTNCTTCGGEGRGGLNGPGTIGSGEIMIDQDTGEQLTAADLVERAKLREGTNDGTTDAAVPHQGHEHRSLPHGEAVSGRERSAGVLRGGGPTAGRPEQDLLAEGLPRADIHLQDCIVGMRERLEQNSVHLTVTSIPFEELFTYSGKLEDVGNNGSTIDIREGRFALNLRFVIAELFRVTAPGCNVCIHIQQLLAYKNQHGFSGRRDFRGAVIDLFRASDFRYHGEWAIPKDPQAMAQRLNLHSLQFKTGYARSATNWAGAPNDYVLVFQKPGDVAVPVRCLRHEQQNPGGWLTQDQWIRWASGVWDDIDEFDIIDGARSAREHDEEKHVCPLQLEIIRRCIQLYTNPRSIQPDVLVLDPFMGVGSTAREAILLDRNVVGFELKESYHANAIKNVARARAEAATPVDAQLSFVDAGGGQLVGSVRR
jgi:hypothetical protein